MLEPAGRGLLRGRSPGHGATLDSRRSPPTTPTWRATPDLSAAYRRNAESLGRHFDADDPGAPAPTFSTDMANVSLAVPTIHPLIGVETHGAVNHQPEFAAACITPSADAAVRDGALAMAWTAIDAAVPGPLATTPGRTERAERNPVGAPEPDRLPRSAAHTSVHPPPEPEERTRYSAPRAEFGRSPPTDAARQ